MTPKKNQNHFITNFKKFKILWKNLNQDGPPSNKANNLWKQQSFVLNCEMNKMNKIVNYGQRRNK